MQTYARPVAYVRRSSRSRNDPGDLSREFQVMEVRRLAGADADQLDVRDSDWGRSASTDKTYRRLAFLAILEEVERGEVSALYAYSTDRLARSVRWSAQLLDACRRAGTIIVTSEGRFEPDNAMTDQLFYFQAMQNEGYSRQASQKRRSTVAAQRGRGARLGVAPYGALAGESVEPIIAAYRKAGSCYGAARILNQAGSRTRRGAHWSSKVVGDVLERARVAYRHRKRPGAKAAADWVTFRLLTCHCGNVMTAMDRRSPRVTCYKARHDPTHPKPFGISEAKLLPALQAEAAHLRPPHKRVSRNSGSTALGLEAVDQRREALLDLYLDNPNRMTKEQLDVRLAKLDEERSSLVERLQADAVVDLVPSAVDWSQPPTVINEILRAMWERVELGPDLMPKSDGFLWRRPEWRA